MCDELLGLADVVVTVILIEVSTLGAEPAPTGWTMAQDQVLPERSVACITFRTS
jgi:hypothetical protein